MQRRHLHTYPQIPAPSTRPKHPPQTPTSRPQVYELSQQFLPKDWIMEKWEEGFYITAMAGGWHSDMDLGGTQISTLHVAVAGTCACQATYTRLGVLKCVDCMLLGGPVAAMHMSQGHVPCRNCVPFSSPFLLSY